MDHLSDLSDAIAGLQDVLSGMGASIRLTGIEIDDERGGEVFDFLLRRSLSSAEAGLYPDTRSNPRVRKLLGVPILAVPRSNLTRD